MLENKSAIITGGSKGIGYSIAESMLKNNMQVCITGRSEKSINEALESLRGIGKGKVIGIACDVRDFEAQAKVVDKTISEFGKVDVMVANAGLGHFAPVQDLSLKQWHETIDINLTGVFYSIKSAFEALKASNGYFITIASLAGTNFFANGAAYNASKFGLVGFTQAAMLDLRKHGIKTTTIMPGSVSTYFNNRTPGDNDAWKIQPEDIGEMVIDLLRMPSRTLPSKVEVRPSFPPGK